MTLPSCQSISHHPSESLMRYHDTASQQHMYTGKGCISLSSARLGRASYMVSHAGLDMCMSIYHADVQLQGSVTRRRTRTFRSAAIQGAPESRLLPYAKREFMVDAWMVVTLPACKCKGIVLLIACLTSQM